MYSELLIFKVNPLAWPFSFGQTDPSTNVFHEDSVHVIAVVETDVSFMVSVVDQVLIVPVVCAHNALLLPGVQDAHEEQFDQDEQREVDGDEPPEVIINCIVAIVPWVHDVADFVKSILNFVGEEAEPDGIAKCDHETNEVGMEEVPAVDAILLEEADGEAEQQQRGNRCGEPVFHGNCCD